MAKSSAKSASAGPNADTRICVLHGPEELLIQTHFQSLRQAMTQAHDQVDVLTFDGEVAELADVLDELRTMGLMQQYKIVVVDKADKFTTEHRPLLERYAANPEPNATLVLKASRWYAGKLDKLIGKVGCVISCKALSRAQVVPWIIDRAKTHHQCKIDRGVAQVLAERLGGNLSRIEGELAKLAINAGSGNAITRDMIEGQVGRSSDEQAYAMQEAMLTAMVEHQPGVAIEKIHELIDLSGQPKELVAYFLGDLCRKLQIGMMMKKQGAGPQQRREALRLWGSAASQFEKLLSRLDDRRTADLFDRIIGYDAGSKSGLGEAVRNIECFCASLADN